MDRSSVSDRIITAAGLLIEGALISVPGLTVVPPASRGGPAWNRLDPGDFMPRQHAPSIICLHTTGGHWPQPVIEEARTGGHAREILEMWSGADRGGGERQHSAAPLVVDFNGDIYCAADIVTTAAYHARAINARSVGIEMCTYRDGSITRATLRATALLVAALTHSGMPGSGLLAIPAQMARGPYRGDPLRRLEVGGVGSDGAGLVGVIGHRDQTAQRGCGDPGAAIWGELAALGFEGVDYDGHEDLELGRDRQAVLNARGSRAGETWRPLVVDGVCGPASLAAMRRQGFARWRDVA